MSQGTLTTSRRLFLGGSLATVAGAMFPPLGAKAFAQKASVTAAEFRASGKNAKILTRALRGNVSVLMGSGGNIIVLPGTDGMVTVDSGLATSQAQIRTALDAFSVDPVRHLLNTHWHFDHTDGNEWMH